MKPMSSLKLIHAQLNMSQSVSRPAGHRVRDPPPAATEAADSGLTRRAGDCAEGLCVFGTSGGDALKFTFRIQSAKSRDAGVVKRLQVWRHDGLDPPLQALPHRAEAGAAARFHGRHRRGKQRVLYGCNVTRKNCFVCFGLLLVVIEYRVEAALLLLHLTRDFDAAVSQPDCDDYAKVCGAESIRSGTGLHANLMKNLARIEARGVQPLLALALLDL